MEKKVSEFECSEMGDSKKSTLLLHSLSFFLGMGSMNRRLIPGYPSMSWMSRQWARGILILRPLRTACEMADWKQHFCHSAFSREMGPPSILRTRERRYLCQCPCSLSSVVSQLAGQLSINRQTPSPEE